MNEEILQYSVHNRVVTLTLNRPQARNAFNAALRHALSAAIERALADPQVRALLIAANGPVFSAGADLAELQQPVFCHKCSWSRTTNRCCCRSTRHRSR